MKSGTLFFERARNELLNIVSKDEEVEMRMRMQNECKVKHAKNMQIMNHPIQQEVHWQGLHCFHLFILIAGNLPIQFAWKPSCRRHEW